MRDYSLTPLYKDCLSLIQSPELKLNLNLELSLVSESGVEFDTRKPLILAFLWRMSPQGRMFWHDIYNKRTPKEYL
jgi:hypothetical protein